MAAAAGIRALHADVLPSNQAVRALLSSAFGPGLRYLCEDGVVRYRVPLTEGITAEAAPAKAITAAAAITAAEITPGAATAAATA